MYYYYTIVLEIDPLKELATVSSASATAAINVINRVRRQLFNTVFDLRGDNDPVTLFYVCI
jgi:hypothetical protein